MTKPTRFKAQAGDLILVTNSMFPGGKYSTGDILEVIESNDAGVRTNKGEVFNEEFEITLVDILKTLSRKVSSLEDQLRMSQNNIETLAQENGSLTSKLYELREITESNTADIVFLDERAQTHNFSVNLRIDRDSDVEALTELFTKILAKDGAAE